MPEQKPDDLAAELVPDPTKLPDVVVLKGYLGKSTRAGFSRLYVNLSFSEYVEVADEDVRRQPLPCCKPKPSGWHSAVGQAECDASACDGLLGTGARGLSEGRDHCKCIAPIQDGTPCRAEASRLSATASGPTDPLFYSYVSGPIAMDPAPRTDWPLSRH